MKSPTIILTLTTLIGLTLVAKTPVLGAQQMVSNLVTSDLPANLPSPCRHLDPANPPSGIPSELTVPLKTLESPACWSGPRQDSTTSRTKKLLQPPRTSPQVPPNPATAAPSYLDPNPPAEVPSPSLLKFGV